MRTTLDLPDELFRQVKARAAVKGTTLKELLTLYVETGLRRPDSAPSLAGKRSSLPVIKARNKRTVPNLTPELQAKLEAVLKLAAQRLLIFRRNKILQPDEIHLDVIQVLADQDFRLKKLLRRNVIGDALSFQPFAERFVQVLNPDNAGVLRRRFRLLALLQIPEREESHGQQDRRDQGESAVQSRGKEALEDQPQFGQAEADQDQANNDQNGRAETGR